MVKWIKNEWRKHDFLYAVLIIAIFAYLGFGIAFNYLKDTVAQQFLAGAFSALFVYILVGLLIRIQRGKDHEQKVFETKIKLYTSVIEHLKDIVLTNNKEAPGLATVLEFDLIKLIQMAENQTIEKFYSIFSFTQLNFAKKNKDGAGYYTFFEDTGLRVELLKKIGDFAKSCRTELELNEGPEIENLFTVDIPIAIEQAEENTQRDYTKYILTLTKNGEKTDKLNKRQTVLKVMKYLIDEQIIPPKDIEELGKKRYGNNLHLLEHFELPLDITDVSLYVKSELDKKKVDQTRYFTDSEDIIKRQDLKKVFVVSNQWGSGNLPEFLSDIEKKYGDYVKYSEVK